MKVKVIAETAVGAALVVLFVLIASYIPFFAGIGAIISGIPLVYLSVKNGYASGICGAVVAFVISFALTGNLLSVGIIFLSYTLLGLAFGIAISKNIGFYSAVMIAGVVALIGVIVDIVLVVGGTDGINSMLDIYFKEVQTALNEVYSIKGISADADVTKLISDATQIVRAGIKFYLPSILIIVAYIYAYIVSFVSAFILKRLKIKTIDRTPFNMLRAPGIVCGMTVVLFILSFIVGGEGVFFAAIKNVLLISEIIIGICGFAFVDYKFSKVLNVTFIRILIYLGVFSFLSILVPFIADIMVLIGFLTSPYPVDK